MTTDKKLIKIKEERERRLNVFFDNKKNEKLVPKLDTGIKCCISC